MLGLKGKILKTLERREEVQRVVAEIHEVDLPPSSLNPKALRRVEELEDYAAQPRKSDDSAERRKSSDR